MNLKKHLKTLFALLLFIFLISFQSCNKDVVEDKEVITIENFELLKANTQNLIQRSLSSLDNTAKTTSVNFEQVLTILEQHEGFTYDELPTILGDLYNETYFTNLVILNEITMEVYNSDLFNENTAMEDRQPFVEDIIFYTLMNHNNILIDNFSSKAICHDPDRLTICEDKAKTDHGRRLASATATAGVVSFFGTPAAGAAVFVIASVASGYQYDADIDYCYEQFC